MQIICYPRCTTCKKAVNWLEKQGVDFEYRDIKEKNPKKTELKKWHKASGLSLKKFFNTSGQLYREMNLKDKLADMTEEEMYELLASDGMLVKRPLLITEEKVLVGFKEDEWKSVLD